MKRKWSATAILFCTTCLASGPVLAQALPGEPVTQPGEVAAEAAEAKRDEEIIVTGSRIARTGVEAPSPVTVVTSDELMKSSPSTLAAALNNLPALVAAGGPNATAGRTSSGRNSLNLRGLGNSRTLVMVDGRRFPGSTPGGSVDTNLIPQALCRAWKS